MGISDFNFIFAQKYTPVGLSTQAQITVASFPPPAQEF
jgi:hypothetical protein